MTRRPINPAVKETPKGMPANPELSYDPHRTILYGEGDESFSRTLQDARDATSKTQVAKWSVDIGSSDQLPDSVFPRPSQDVLPHFALLRVVGKGGIGEVWEAFQSSLGRVVAVKRLRGDIAREDEVKALAYEVLFRREALTTGGLEHPNIVPVYDLGHDEDGQPLLAMKMIRGELWDDLICRDFCVLPPVEFLSRHLPILIDVSNAVAYAHSREIIHRDLKPSQVMVGKFGEVLLMDWGLAVSMREDPNDLPSFDALNPGGSLAPSYLTASNPSGTPTYMAPEQTEKTAHRLGPWTDIYLLGGILYKLLTGRPPHSGKTSKEAFAKAQTNEIEPVEKVAGKRDAPPELIELAMRALATLPGDRPATVLEFIRGLQDYLSGAGKRRESQSLTEQVALRAGKLTGDYKQMTACLNQLGRAGFLWPENPQVAPLRQRILINYAETALDNGDLVLARVQTERLGEGAERAALMGRIAVVEEEKRQAAERLERAYQRVRDEHGRAENLMNFMMQDLHESLMRHGHLDLLEKIAHKAREYYESLPKEDVDTQTLHNRALAVRNIGDVLRDQGNVEEALKAFLNYQSIAATLHDMEPKNKAWLAAMSEAGFRVGM
ncbi:protein kinase, partial [Candidatus Poribacteria bacterium]|nr:protein kinase [Candidatus Poribacteria bacterium]